MREVLITTGLHCILRGPQPNPYSALSRLLEPLQAVGSRPLEQLSRSPFRRVCHLSSLSSCLDLHLPRRLVLRSVSPCLLATRLDSTRSDLAPPTALSHILRLPHSRRLLRPPPSRHLRALAFPTHTAPRTPDLIQLALTLWSALSTHLDDSPRTFRACE